MYLWTVQSDAVIKTLLEEGKYFPDIKKSKGYSDMRKTYPLLLDKFNRLNKSEWKGLIFGFSEITGQGYFNTIEELYRYLYKNPDVAVAFNFWEPNYSILQIEVDETLNIMPADFNDIIKISIDETNDINLMQRLSPSKSAFKDEVYNIKMYMSKGIKNPVVKFKSFIEGHYPYLELKSIVGIYPNMDNLKSKSNNKIELFDLSEDGLKLKNSINK